MEPVRTAKVLSLSRERQRAALRALFVVIMQLASRAGVEVARKTAGIGGKLTFLWDIHEPDSHEIEQKPETETPSSSFR